MGPARSESSMMCWSMRARGFSTAKVYTHVSLVSSNGTLMSLTQIESCC